MSKEAIMLVIDVGATMKKNPTELENAKTALSDIVSQQLLFSKRNEVGIVLFGTKNTDNPLAEDLGGYENITVLKDLNVPDMDYLTALEAVEAEGGPSDFIEAMVVGMHVMQEKIQKKKYTRRLFLVTDAETEIEGVQDLEAGSDFMSSIDNTETKVNVIGLGFDDVDEEDEYVPDASKSATKVANEKRLREMCDTVREGRVTAVENVLDMVQTLRSKSVTQTRKFTGTLDIGPELSIPLHGFNKCAENKFPSLKKLSMVADGEGGVSMDRSYYSLAKDADPEEEVPEEERVRAYRYGKHMVPFDPDSADMLKYRADKCLQVIGFMDKDLVPRSMYMSNVEVFIADPAAGDSTAMALSALCFALAETNRVAVVRYVKRNNSTSACLGVLISGRQGKNQCLFWNQLPFSEDIRDYKFASIVHNVLDSKKRPQESQLKAAADLVDSLDLMNPDEDGDPDEMLNPKKTYNPILQRFYCSVIARAKDPTASLQAAPADVAQYCMPDEEIFGKSKRQLDAFVKQFPITKKASTDKGKRRFWKDTEEEGGLKRTKTDEGAEDIFASLNTKDVKEVGTVTPVDDFTAMVRNSKADLVEDAINQMQAVIFKLVDTSVKSQMYGKAIDCMTVLRQECIKEDEPGLWNDFLKKARGLYENHKARNEFWELVSKKALTLISDEESPNSQISTQEASQFLVQPMEVETTQGEGTAEPDDVDDLLLDAE
eukprot:GFYU01007816.1.p1 GENE.GFYU01007816.1~~GFYU01007816.1.p1  ORF type:complete len:757 (-),score=282.95 GFYU01007816.1:39-2186(-)